MNLGQYFTFSLGCEIVYGIHTQDVIEVVYAVDSSDATLLIHDRMVTLIDACGLLQSSYSSDKCAKCIRACTPSKNQVVVIRLTGSDTFYGFRIVSAYDVIEYPLDKIKAPVFYKPGNIIDGIIHENDKFTFIINEQTLAQQLVTDDYETDIELF